VSATVIDSRYLVEGAQPYAALAQVIKQIDLEKGSAP
jgi:predicted DsbA family dithiol-disulfide isomerase